MKYILLISAVCVALLFSSPGWAASPGKAAVVAGLSIAQPPERSIVQSGLLVVVLKSAAGLLDEIQISVNNRKQALAPKTFTQNVVCYDGIRLTYGLNTVKVSGFKNKKKTIEITRQVFYQDELSTGSISVPAGFKTYRFHIDENEKECAPCHGLDFRKAEDPQDDPLRSPCYLCHKKMLSEYKFTHGPSAAWSCLTCHDGKSRKPKLAVATPIAPTCSGCHDTSWGDKKYQHAPTAAGACTTCHNPHAEDRQFFLRKDIVDLCATCHEEILSRPHVISSFSGGGHPLNLSPNPLNPGNNLTCASCHNPHRSNSSRLLNDFDDSRPLDLFCRTCHKF